jgi:hypothetical protein
VWVAVETQMADVEVQHTVQVRVQVMQKNNQNSWLYMVVLGSGRNLLPLAVFGCARQCSARKVQFFCWQWVPMAMFLRSA